MSLHQGQEQAVAATLSESSLHVYANQDQVLERTLVHVLKTFGYSIVENADEADVVITRKIDASLKQLRAGKAVIQLCGSYPYDLASEVAKRDPELRDRYREADVKGSGPLLQVISHLSDFKNLEPLPKAKPLPEELGLPSNLSVTTMEEKRVLVLDDSALNIKAAQYQFGSKNEVVVFETYERAVHALVNEDFDYALLDLLMEPEAFLLGSSAYAKVAGSEFPAGSIIGLIAAAKRKLQVFVVTDASHHDHPATALLDHLWRQPIHFANGSILEFRAATTKAVTTGAARVKDWVASIEK